MKSRIAITIAVLLASLSSIAEEKPAERAPLELDFSSSDWIEDEELSSALSTRQAYTDEAIAAGADNPPYWDSSNSIQAVPASFTPWWATEALKPLSKRSTPVIETPESLALRAIKNSNQIRVFSDIPVIRETAELEARGEFDTHLYLDGKFTIWTTRLAVCWIRGVMIALPRMSGQRDWACAKNLLPVPKSICLNVSAN